jgi:hypothetical protein
MCYFFCWPFLQRRDAWVIPSEIVTKNLFHLFFKQDIYFYVYGDGRAIFFFSLFSRFFAFLLWHVVIVVVVGHFKHKNKSEILALTNKKAFF